MVVTTPKIEKARTSFVRSFVRSLVMVSASFLISFDDCWESAGEIIITDKVKVGVWSFRYNSSFELCHCYVVTASRERKYKCWILRLISRGFENAWVIIEDSLELVTLKSFVRSCRYKFDLRCKYRQCSCSIVKNRNGNSRRQTYSYILVNTSSRAIIRLFCYLGILGTKRTFRMCVDRIVTR